MLQMSEETNKDPMALTVGEYFKLKAEMETEMLKSLQSIVAKYRAKLGMTPSWIEVEQVEQQGIGERRKQSFVTAVRCNFEIQ